MKLTRLIALASAAAIAFLPANPALADEPATVTQSDATPEPGRPALWKVTDEDTTIYMFGTVHMLPDTVEWSSGPVDDALKSADALVTELDLTPETEAEIGLAFQRAGMLPEGETLRGLMTPEQLETYEAGLAKIGVPAETFDPMEPWLASIVMFQIVAQASGFTPEMGVEAVLEGMVAPDTRRVALEDVQTQIDVFDKLPMDLQMVYFLEVAADPMASITSLNELVAEWAEGDADTVGALMNEALKAHPQIAERLLYSRNAAWAEWIENRLDEPGTVFMAVGAGHLAGEQSVQELLTERAIAVARVQ